MNRRIVQQDNQWKIYPPDVTPEPYVFPWEKRAAAKQKTNEED